ncbi:MAG: inorganic pyrophosphatase Ppa [Spirochaetes bacterium]|nr:inorganic pyrophosphatase Ppa [Spirochaetota bacterium]
MPDQYIRELIKKSRKEFAVQKYRETDIGRTHRPFKGTPKKHPYDENLLILMTKPFAKNHEFYEFTVDSIGHIEEIGTITNEDGRSAMHVRIWVKKGVPAIRSKPFIV